MVKWEFMDLAEFRPRSAADKVVTEADTQRLVVLPGFEVSQARKKPITDIFSWVQSFARYTAAMAAQFPACTAGFMSHQLVVVKAYLEIEGQAWRLYNEAFREKMASTGEQSWKGMDVQLFQEMCGGGTRRKAAWQVESKGAGPAAMERGGGGERRRPPVCWGFNVGSCSYGRACKFPHQCEICRGSHPKSKCASSPGGGGAKRQRLG